MPKKLLALLLSIIALFAIIDLARSAKVQLAQTFGGRSPVTTTDAAEDVAEPSRAVPRKVRTAGSSKTGIAPTAIVPANWDGTATR